MGKIRPEITLESEARACGEAFGDEPVSADLYLKNEALISFISGETGVAQVRDLAEAIHARFSRASNELSGVRDVLYSGNSSGPVDSITRILQGGIARLTTGKERGDAVSEGDYDGENGRGGGNGTGKSERLAPGWVGKATVVKLFSDGFKVTVPGGGKSVVVYCSKTGGFKAGQPVTVRMTGEKDAWKNPIAQLVSVS